MPILGLFPSAVEDQRRREAEAVARGRTMSAGSNAANTAIQQGVGQARKGAFAQAYQNRSNPALAQRQAQEAATSATMQGAGQMAMQRAGDVNQARQDLSAMDAQRMAGINSAIGFGAQAVGTLFGGPAGGAAAGQLTNGISQPTDITPPAAPPGLLPRPPQQTAPGSGLTAPLFQQQGQAYDKRQGGPNITEDPSGALGLTTTPERISQANPDFVQQAPAQPLTSPLEPPPAAGIASLYERMGNQRDPAVDEAWRRRQRFSNAYRGR